MAVVSVIAMIARPLLFLLLRLWSARPVKAYADCMNFWWIFHQWLFHQSLSYLSHEVSNFNHNALTTIEQRSTNEGTQRIANHADKYARSNLVASLCGRHGWCGCGTKDSRVTRRQ